MKVPSTHPQMETPEITKYKKNNRVRKSPEDEHLIIDEAPINKQKLRNPSKTKTPNNEKSTTSKALNKVHDPEPDIEDDNICLSNL